jgi:hypothetical protein
LIFNNAFIKVAIVAASGFNINLTSSPGGQIVTNKVYLLNLKYFAMKLLIALAFILPIAATGQTITDYKHAMAKFQKFYNAGRGDSINAMFGHDWDQMKISNPLWTNKQNDAHLAEFGTLKSFKFIGVDSLDPNKVYVFETFFSKAGTYTTSLTLDKDHKLGTFRFITSSDGITALQNKRKRNN